MAAHFTIIARDRGGGCGEAAAKGLPHAARILDRWHLIEDTRRAAVRKSMRQVRPANAATAIDHKLLTATERLQYDEEYLSRAASLSPTPDPGACYCRLPQVTPAGCKDYALISGHAKGQVLGAARPRPIQLGAARGTMRLSRYAAGHDHPALRFGPLRQFSGFATGLAQIACGVLALCHLCWLPKKTKSLCEVANSD